MSKKLKILVCGDVEGNFKTLFSRVNAINKKNGPFDFLFCVGDFFADNSQTFKDLEPYKNGTLAVSVPTYILGPSKESHLSFYSDLSGCEICPNVSFLGKHGILSSSSLRIAYVSGFENGENDVMFTDKDARSVREAAFKKWSASEFLGVDVLLSSDWPKGVQKLDKNAKFNEEDLGGSKILAELACSLKPRYHFSGSKNIFYERPPYRNCSENNSKTHTTRFIGLAKVGNASKNKWLYAANITPLSDLNETDLLQATTDETKCPYYGLIKREAESRLQYFYDMNALEEVAPKKRRRNDSQGNEKKKNFTDVESCWFCLASASVEKHLVISIAEEMYLALAKGGLTPYHVMIVPIMHHRSQIDLPKTALKELKQYKLALKEFYESKNQIPVIFERNFKTSHLQLHIVPVPKSSSSRLKEVFLNSSEVLGLNLSELPDGAKLKDFVQPNVPYFYVELPTKEKLICSCQKNFPIHFGREVLASKAILNIPNKVNWRECIQSKEEEEKMAQNFRSQFDAYDKFS